MCVRSYQVSGGKLWVNLSEPKSDVTTILRTPYQHSQNTRTKKIGLFFEKKKK